MDLILRARAPLRISFAGGGTDVSHYADLYGGAVIATTIDKYAYVSVKKVARKGITIVSQDYDVTSSSNAKGKNKHDEKLKLVHAVLKRLKVSNVNLEINTIVDASPGSGLGSSSSIVVALTGAIYRLFGKTYTNYDISDMAYKIERIDCGIKGGLQDQYISSFGGFNFIEFRKSSVIVTPIRIREEIINELLSSLVLVDTTQRRRNDIYDKIIEKQLNTSKEKGGAIDNLHIIKELAYKMKDNLLKGNLQMFGEHLHEGWIHKKSIDPHISNKYIDNLYNLSLEAGATGGKLLGAGGGGYLLIFAPIEKKNNVIKNIVRGGGIISSFNFDSCGLKTWALSRNGVLP